MEQLHNIKALFENMHSNHSLAKKELNTLSFVSHSRATHLQHIVRRPALADQERSCSLRAVATPAIMQDNRPPTATNCNH